MKVIVFAAATGLYGCSAAMQPPPARPPMASGDEIMCTDSKAAPLADTVVSSLLLVAAANAGVYTAYESQHCRDCTTTSGIVATSALAGAALVGFISAGYGYGVADDCRAMKARQAPR